MDKYHTLEGLDFDDTDRPAEWINPSPLIIPNYVDKNSIFFHILPFANFPLITDFQIRLEDIRKDGKSLFGYHILFFSPTFGYIGALPFWNNADQYLMQQNFKIPNGTCNAPFHDEEYGWEMFIATQNEMVYILEGENGESTFDGYSRWFKVPEKRYVESWRAAITLVRGLPQSR